MKISPLAVTIAILLAGCQTFDPTRVTIHKAYEKRWEYGPDDAKAIVLYLHGAGGFSSTQNLGMEWRALFRQMGYKVIVPSSFADYRPPPATMEAWPVVERQAVDSLERIRARFPGKPIVVWGHSEGAAGALRINDPDLAAIVALGWGCTPDIRVHNSTPLLVLLGGKDHIHRAFRKLYETKDPPPRVCRKMAAKRGARKWTIHFDRAMEHNVYLSRWPEAGEAVKKFLEKHVVLR